MTDHDATYHQLYSHPPMVADLVRQFVNEPWVADLDFTQMERVNAKFTVRNLPKRRGDVIWRIPTQSGSFLYLLTLLEFQSRTDRWMIVRIIVYSCLLWLQLLHEKKISADGLLPPVFPVVIYNGDPPWLTPVSLRNLINLPEGSPLWNFQPSGRFYLIDESHYSPEYLQLKDFLSALVFRLEQCRNPEALPELAAEVVAWISQHSEFKELEGVIADMLWYAMSTLSGSTPTTPKFPHKLMEMPTMLQTRMEDWKNQKQQEWWQGGRQEGSATLLLLVLEEKFGKISGVVRNKVLKADRASLEKWSRRVVKSDTLDGVFAV